MYIIKHKTLKYLIQVQVHDNPASYPVVELPVEATQVGHVSSHLDILDDDEASLEYQALRVKAYGDGLGSGFAGTIKSSNLLCLCLKFRNKQQHVWLNCEITYNK